MRKTYRNHVLPEWYLNQWLGDDGLLRVKHISSGRRFKQISRHVCFQKELYTDLCEESFAQIEGVFLEFWNDPESFISTPEGRISLLRFILQLAARQPSNVARLIAHFGKSMDAEAATLAAEAYIWSGSSLERFRNHSWYLYKSDLRLLNTSECAVLMLNPLPDDRNRDTIYMPFSPGKGLLIWQGGDARHGWNELTIETAKIFNDQLEELTETHLIFGQDSPEFKGFPNE